MVLLMHTCTDLVPYCPAHSHIIAAVHFDCNNPVSSTLFSCGFVLISSVNTHKHVYTSWSWDFQFIIMYQWWLFTVSSLWFTPFILNLFHFLQHIANLCSCFIFFHHHHVAYNPLPFLGARTLSVRNCPPLLLHHRSMVHFSDVVWKSVGLPWEHYKFSLHCLLLWS